MRFETPLAARGAVRALTASKIRELYNEGLGKPDVLPFWVGEPDQATPEFIRKAGMDSIAAGEVFYTHNLGIPELRGALASYVSKLHGRTDAAQIAVTSAGVNALMVASQLLVDPGDRVVVKPGTRALYLNSPNNPTGWTISPEEQRALLEHCRRHGIWIIADDAYERLYFGAGGVAPSFLNLAEEEDRVISANTFSKSWLMTGWRLGWLVVPQALTADLGKLIEYNTSCAPVFVQRAGIAAVREGEPVIARTLWRLRQARDFLVSELQKTQKVKAVLPAGAMYAFFGIEGMHDSLAFCKRLVRDTGLGLAPGAAFGPEGEGFVRWCFAATEERLADGIKRLRRAL